MSGAVGSVTLIHNAVPGRARLHVPGLRGSPSLKRAIEASLRSWRNVISAHGSVSTGNILVLCERDADMTSVVHVIEEAVDRSRKGFFRPEIDRTAARPWHALGVEEAFRRLRSSIHGLSGKTFHVRLRRYGENVLPAIPGRGRAEIIIEQFQSLPVALLLGAAALSVLTGAAAEAVTVLSVVFLNAGIGYFTEAHAERAVRSLSKSMVDRVPVIRDGKREAVPVQHLVPGDILELLPGTIVGADARVIRAHGLAVNEAVMTGESAPVLKTSEALRDQNTLLADRINIVYRGTIVTGGSGQALVTATGASTEIGQLHGFLGTARPPETPLQKQLGYLGKQLTLVASAACVFVFGVGLLRGYGMFATAKNAIALAVAAVPEGLPTLATTTLALGVREMRRRNVLVRRLDAVETLASVRVFCLDKTGTLTFNRMSVSEVSCGSRAYAVNEDGLLHDSHGNEIFLSDSGELKKLCEIVTLCNEAALSEESGGQAAASSTETALLQFAIGVGLDARTLRNMHPIHRIAYRTERQMFMVSLHPSPAGGRLAMMKGSPEAVIGLCDRILLDGREVEFTDARQESAKKENDRLAGMGRRVLAAAYKRLESGDEDLHQKSFTFVGLIGLSDPLRPGVAQLLSSLRQAGIKPVMITGDQLATAAAIARDATFGDGELSVVNADSPAAKDRFANENDVPHVFARVTPAQKLDIVRALQRSGFVVAMTGDGVNDSPALKAADIGVAMGRSGSEAAREVAHIVLDDDNLASILSAIELGRATHANVRKAIRYLLATNMSEILLMLAAPLANMGQPLTPTQLLWVNLITDVAPALALGVEPPHDDMMRAPPMAPEENIVDLRKARTLGREAALITMGSFGAYAYGCARYGVSRKAGSVCFATIVTSQLLHALSCRSKEHFGLSRQLLRNHALSLVILGSFALQAAMMAFAPLRNILGVQAIGPADALVSFGAALASFAGNEAIKLRDAKGVQYPKRGNPS